MPHPPVRDWDGTLIAEIGQPEREIDARPAEPPVPSELPLDPPVPAPREPAPEQEPSVGTVWPARRELQSGCFIQDLRPAVQHRCGIHAFGAQEDAMAYAEASQERLTLFDHRPVGIAVGRVSCWGHVVHHTLGWRSQFAYPYDLFLLSADPSLARLLSRRYAVDTTEASGAYGTLRAYSRN